MLLLEQNTTKRGQVDNKALPEPKTDLEFEAKDDKEYEVKVIIDNTAYSQ